VNVHQTALGRRGFRRLLWFSHTLCLVSEPAFSHNRLIPHICKRHKRSHKNLLAYSPYGYYGKYGPRLEIVPRGIPRESEARILLSVPERTILKVDRIHGWPDTKGPVYWSTRAQFWIFRDSPLLRKRRQLVKNTQKDFDEGAAFAVKN
jgi:hypothetical protein